jgi:hypothetical protein
MMHTHQKSSDPVATIGLDIGKNTFHRRHRHAHRATSLCVGLSISQPALSAWKQALARIISRARCSHSGMTFA